MLRLVGLAAVALAATTAGVAFGGHDGPRPLNDDARWTTVFKPPAGVSVEGLTADRRGDLYTPGRGVVPCPVFRIRAGTSAVVGNLPGPCNPAGLAFGPDGRLYIADSGRIMVLRPDAAAPPTATVFASGVQGSNGVVFDRRGDLWVSDGGTGQGRVWRIGRDGVPQEVFRVQPIANDLGIGRDVRALPPGTITITENGRQASNTLGSQHLVANGLAFDDDGRLFVADTARGAIWRVHVDHRGRLLSRTGCDSTFTPNTLCLDAVMVQHPYLEGADGIVLDDDENIFVSVNERNSIAVVTDEGRAVEYFRNPVAAGGLRNAGPLEFPTSPVLVRGKLCTANSDGNRRDNSPPDAGEGPKVNCVG